jgi:hypothetical protein
MAGGNLSIDPLKSHWTMYILENWRLEFGKNAAQDAAMRINGTVWGNPSYRAGKAIHTSTIVGYREESDNLVVMTITGSEYLLGKPDPTRPFALRRLMRYLHDIERFPPRCALLDWPARGIDSQVNL